jgi:hypothetical protein
MAAVCLLNPCDAPADDLVPCLPLRVDADRRARLAA